MLNEELIDKVIERLVVRLEEGNEYVLKQIGKSIKKIGTLSASDVQRLGQLIKYGGDYDKIVRKLSQITDLNVKDIYTIFDEVAKNDYKFAKQFYDYKNVKYIPYEQNLALQNQVRALANITAGQYANFSNTMAFATTDNLGNIIYTDLSTAYQDMLDKAILSVSQGKTTFNEEISQAMKNFAEKGIRTVEYASGRHMRLDSALRMNMKAGIKDLHHELQKQFGEEFGADGWEVSVHGNPAPDHEEVQGRQFSKEEFDRLQSYGVAKDYKGRTIDLWNGKSFRPIGQLNCYHYEFAIILGVNTPEYTDEQLQQIIDDNNKGFELDGKHYTNYEGQQLQRQLERRIREQKDIQIGAKASGLNDLVAESQKKITALTKK